jgi:hypothetical protein
MQISPEYGQLQGQKTVFVTENIGARKFGGNKLFDQSDNR